MYKETIVIHSGGMDSSICLALAIRDHGVKNVLSLSFSFNQRHINELDAAAKICKEWNVDHKVITLPDLSQLTDNALINSSVPITGLNTLVVGRNGLMARLGAIQADSLGAQSIYMGVMGLEEANSGYRDCSREYMDLMQEILRIDLANPSFEIRTPLVHMTKAQTLDLAQQLGAVDFLLDETITCYEGIPKLGCQKCPACILRNEGVREWCGRES